MGKRILLYYPPNNRSVAIETMCKALVDAGHQLMVLTLTPRGSFHEAVEKKDIQTFTSVAGRKPTWKYFLTQGRYLIRFCKTHRIDVVWSHLQEANIIALLSQRFLKADVVAFRHHAESSFYAEYGRQFGMQRNKNEIRFDKIINRLAHQIIVPSSGVWKGMEQYEKCDMRKVRLVPYIYDFSEYARPDAKVIRALKDKYPCHLRIIMVSRMISSKQHMPVFEIVRQLISEGLSIKLIVMDDGPLRPQLEDFVAGHDLQDHIFFVGFSKDFINYMAACHLLMHPSLTEASSNVVKEMGLLKKAVAVCEGVGDFDDYITDGINGYKLTRSGLKESIERVIRQAYSDLQQDILSEMGEKLRTDILELFSDSPANRTKFLNLI